MEFITITAVDQHSSDTMSRTFNTKSINDMKESIKEFETELPYRRYELMSDELMEDYNDDIINVLDELEVNY